jgi:hypothetical protein
MKSEGIRSENCAGEKCVQCFVRQSERKSGHLEDREVDGIIILEWILGNQVWRMRIALIWLRTWGWRALVDTATDLSIP